MGEYEPDERPRTFDPHLRRYRAMTDDEIAELQRRVLITPDELPIDTGLDTDPITRDDSPEAAVRRWRRRQGLE